MPDNILYSLVARGSVVLAEHSTVSGNANLVAHRILEKIPQQDTKVSYSQERHLFHILVENGITFVCMADEAFERRIPFAFLEDIKQKFWATYGPAAQTAIAYEYNSEFSRVLQQRMAYFSNDASSDTINRIRGEISEVKSIMVENIEKVLDRGEKIELLVDKTDYLQHESFTFKREARRLKSKMYWRNVRMSLLIGFVVLVVIYVIICFVCSPTFKCSRG